ncbi:Uncharacterized protein dnm_038470 [Desulfonema magnum]|uniref:Uncharacterized protein n=1 Tax=Desulfonema magnum TaxID=45655 RepID=A0A975GNI5_9BACT|nr:Uncharacterized protein dnm_038470 [Desulfonema magnum]
MTACEPAVFFYREKPALFPVPVTSDEKNEKTKRNDNTSQTITKKKYFGETDRIILQLAV